MESLRQAPNAGKRPRLLALKSSACSRPEACQVRDVCVSAYEKHLAAVERLDAIKRSLDGDAAASGSAKLLSEAERLLQGASKETKRCADLEAELKRNNKV